MLAMRAIIACDVSASAEDRWGEYSRWNEALAEYFFSPAAANRPVYLDIEEELLISLAERVGAPTSDAVSRFRKAVAQTLSPIPGGRPLMAAHLDRASRWERAGGEGYPPFVAVLGLFCHAAESMRR